MSVLNIKSEADLDFLALGAVVHRLDPGTTVFRKAREFKVHVSGGEYNCAANLSDCFGLNTGVCTAMVNYGIGEMVQARIQETGVRPFYKHFEHEAYTGRTSRRFTAIVAAAFALLSSSTTEPTKRARC